MHFLSYPIKFRTINYRYICFKDRSPSNFGIILEILSNLEGFPTQQKESLVEIHIYPHQLKENVECLGFVFLYFDGLYPSLYGTPDSDSEAIVLYDLILSAVSKPRNFLDQGLKILL